MDQPKQSRYVVVNFPNGLHMRPAMMITNTIGRYNANVEIIKDGFRVDGLSMIDILTLAAEKGSKLKLEATGEDALEVLDELVRLFEIDFLESLNSDQTQSDPKNK